MTPEEALETLHDRATAFVDHWMEDDGNDAEDKELCNAAREEIDNARELLRRLLGL